MTSLFIGCAGWTIPRGDRDHFSAEGTHLERYAATLSCVEINSSFYRPHRPSTYARWAESTPDGFRFAVKVPKEITHKRSLEDTGEPLGRFLSEVHHLGNRLGPLLVQLPPRLKFDKPTAKRFFMLLRQKSSAPVACEPRHATWFTAEADELLAAHQIARVAADPAITQEAAEFGGWGTLRYLRLHGSPKVYYSSYSDEYLASVAERLRAKGDVCDTWCIFDNTAEGAAIRNAIQLVQRTSPVASR